MGVRADGDELAAQLAEPAHQGQGRMGGTARLPQAGGVDLQSQPLDGQLPQDRVDPVLPPAEIGGPLLLWDVPERVGQMGQRVEPPPVDQLQHRVEILVHHQPDVLAGVVVEVIIDVGFPVQAVELVLGT